MRPFVFGRRTSGRMYATPTNGDLSFSRHCGACRNPSRGPTPAARPLLIRNARPIAGKNRIAHDDDLQSPQSLKPLYPAFLGAFEPLLSTLHSTLNPSGRAFQIFHLTFHIGISHKPFIGADLRPISQHQLHVLIPNRSLTHSFYSVRGEFVIRHFRPLSQTIHWQG